MKLRGARLPGPAISAVLLVSAGVAVGTMATRKAPSAKTALACDGEYADSLQMVSPRVREIEQSKRADYAYLVRSFARYECPYYSPDGKLRKRHVETVEHGTGFAYESSNGETFLLTNEHVAVWPEVTDANRHVEGVPEGCKRLDARLRIVQDEHDDYEAGQIPLTLVASDQQLDAAILKSTRPLAVLPYRIGKSAGLRQGNAVQVRGFPLGLIRAVNTGKIVNPHDKDQEQGWDHVDFVIDALLSEGNSGSPVLALSCQTGELQLVGMYHAGYKGHSALNVVIGIDQLREFMAKKRRVARASADANPALSASERKRLRDALVAGALPLFEFGGLHVLVEPTADALVYHLYGRDFPVDDRRLAMLEDRTDATGPAAVGRLWVRSDSGFREVGTRDLGADERDLLVRLSDALRSQMLQVLRYRRTLQPQTSAEDRRAGRELLHRLERHALAARDLASSLIDLQERLAPTRDNAVAVAAPTDAGAPPTPSLRAPHAE